MGAKGASKYLTLNQLLEIRRNKYTSENTSTGIIQDYDKGEVDARIAELSEKKAKGEADLTDKEQRREALLETPTITQMLSAHVKEIERLEEKKAVSILKQYKEARNALRDRLDTVEADTFTAQHLRGVLMQVEQTIFDMSYRLEGGMDNAAQEVAIKGVEHLYDEYSKFDEEFMESTSPINVDQVVIAEDTTNLLANQYESSIKAYSEGVRSQIAMGLTQAAIQELSYSEVIKNLSSFFTKEEWKLHRIVRTELSNVYNLSKMNTMQNLVDTGQAPKLKKTLFNPMDARTAPDSKYVESLHLIVDIDKPFVYTYKGKKFSRMGPPFRPNDRAVLIPYQENW